MGDSEIDATKGLALAAGKGWRDIILTPDCADTSATGFTLSSDAPMQIRIASITRRELPEGTQCSF
jgi:beta-glucosidase